MTTERIETPLEKASRVLIPALCIAIVASLAVAGPRTPAQAAVSAARSDHECLAPEHHASLSTPSVER